MFYANLMSLLLVVLEFGSFRNHAWAGLPPPLNLVIVAALATISEVISVFLERFGSVSKARHGESHLF